MIRIAFGTAILFAVAAAQAESLLPTTAEQQKSFLPSAVLEDLMEGNKRFAAGQPRQRDSAKAIEVSASGQYPKAVILSCLDSRVPVEQVFDQGIGDLFVGRVAGNIENEDLLGSMEFATKVAGAKLVMVLGHDSCGAVQAACDGAELGNLTGLLDKIRPAIARVGKVEGDRSSKNAAFVKAVTEANVRQTLEDIRESSPILAELEKTGQIKIVGAMYSLADGKVSLLQ